MKTITLTFDQRTRFLGWLMHERDHLLALRALARSLMIPGVSGSLEMIENDFSLIESLKRKTQSSAGGVLELGDDETSTLHEISQSNRHQHYAEFWTSIGKLVEGA